MPKRKIVVIVLCVVVVLGVIVGISVTKEPKQPVIITNLNDCTPNINEKMELNLIDVVNSHVELANTYNEQPAAEQYKAHIRNGSCRELSVVDTKTSFGTNTVTTTNFILDVPDAKQSWNVMLGWILKGQKLGTDTGSAQLECPEANQLIYGDFRCINVVSKIKYGTYNYDPILGFVPYDGDSFNLSYDPDTKTVSATVLIQPDQSNNTLLIENVKSAVPIWLRNNGLNPEDYTIKYRVTARQD